MLHAITETDAATNIALSDCIRIFGGAICLAKCMTVATSLQLEGLGRVALWMTKRALLQVRAQAHFAWLWTGDDRAHGQRRDTRGQRRAEPRAGRRFSLVLVEDMADCGRNHPNLEAAMRKRPLLILLFAGGASASSASCASTPEEPANERFAVRSTPLTAPIGQYGEFLNGVVSHHSVYGRAAARPSLPDKGVAPNRIGSPILEPAFRASLASRPLTEVVEALIGIETDDAIDDLPNFEPRESQESANNQRILQGRKNRYADHAAIRLASHRTLLDRVRASGGEVLFQDPMSNSVAIRTTVAQVFALAASPGVRQVEAIGQPDVLTAYAISEGRQDMRSDAIRSAPGYAVYPRGGHIDSGIRSTHTLFQGRIGRLWDCTSGNCNVVSSMSDGCGHGTGTASIFIGNGNLGYDNTGVNIDPTTVIDVWRVMDNACNTNAQGFVTVLSNAALYDQVLTVSIGYANAGPLSAYSVAANTAFDMGAAVIVANGNDLPMYPARAPANAQKVIGVGAYDAHDHTNRAYNVGTGLDGRFKPDLMAPHDINWASPGSDTAMAGFGQIGTSVSAPFVAGSALNLLDMYSNWGICNGLCPPGNIYASLIAFGQYSGGQGTANPTTGSGHTTFPQYGVYCSHWVTGQVTINPGSAADIWFYAGATASESNIRAAIWWPDRISGGYEFHSDADLWAVNPSGSWVQGSTSSDQVWESLSLPGAAQNGWWDFYVDPYSVLTNQVVYYTIYSYTC